MHHEHPELVRDQYWDEVFPSELPYTLASEPFREEHPLPSTANIAVKHENDIMSSSAMRMTDIQDSPVNIIRIHFFFFIQQAIKIHP